MSYPLGHNIKWEHPLKTEIYKRGMTINDFAERVGIDRTTLYRAFRGESLRGCTIAWIAEGLKMPYEEVRNLCNEK